MVVNSDVLIITESVEASCEYRNREDLDFFGGPPPEDLVRRA